ncbi:ATP-dependent DNA helicase pif1-like [Cotesia typhae]|uniref:ATP-dependent DNA helicase pif1-like n=1 Tax=Cotesia typhae TaxID=2053667 RepID=UPI003D68C540
MAKEINDAAQKHDNNNCTLADMIKNMNSDQIKIVCKRRRWYRKSFLINVIKRWIREELNQETVVTAPTGIAAFNINGLTIHRVFQLPVEHGFTPPYTQLSDNVLKALRDQLQNTTLFIIDEISMVSNITLIYIHLRLVEIFDVDDWFGGKHVVVFGDLLQLPPVHENPSYVTLSSQDAEKYVGSMCSLLSRVRVASMTNDDIKLLEQRKITIDPSLSYNEKLHEICNYIDKLPSDSVCLVPTCKQCDLINSVMTSKIFSEEIILTARDHLDCNKSLIKKVSDTLNKIEDNASQSAGLAKTITIKIGAKVMLRQNIDVTLGLVNGAIGTVKSVSKSIDGSEIKAINIDFGADTEYAIEKIKVKFQLFERAFVVREQFPLCWSYAVTIHKSQGLSLKNAIIEAGNTIFNVGQIYVALSRVAESDLPTIPIPNTRWQKVWDMIWAVEEHSIQIEPKNAKKASLSLLDCRGIENCDNVSDGLNSIIQYGNSENHHVVMIKHNLSWIQIDDETVQSVRWPANSKSAYVFFLQKK